jgi:plasmid stabilization system protein ParE
VKLVWSRLALRDIDRQVSYIEQYNALAAKRVEQAFFLAGKKLKEMPELGRQGRRIGTQEYVAFEPYVVVYRVRDQTVRILRIWHGAQIKDLY